MATNDHHCLLHYIMLWNIDGFYIFSSKSWIYLYFSHIMFCTLSNIGSFGNPFPFRSENSERSPKFWDFHFRHVGRSLPHSGADCKRLQSFLPIGPFVDRWAAKLEMKWVCRRKRNTEMSIVPIIHKLDWWAKLDMKWGWRLKRKYTGAEWNLLFLCRSWWFCGTIYHRYCYGSMPLVQDGIFGQYYTLLEQKAIKLIFISIIDININLSKNDIDKKINLSLLKYQSAPLYIVAYVCT